MKNIWILPALIAALLFTVSLPGCSPRKYEVDYGGNKGAFLNAEDSYEAGETVRLRLPLGTDTDYSLSVDGENIKPSVSKNGEKLIFKFTMPAHDIVVELHVRNSMGNPNIPEMPDPPESDDPEGELLFDYYRAPAAVEGPSSYYEITINRGESGTLYLNEYTGDPSIGSTDTHVYYAVNEQALDNVMDIVEEYEMKTWNERDGVSLTGEILVVKFRSSTGELIRVSSDNMPTDGEKAFSEIFRTLSDFFVDVD